jgi:hypothetical protein
VVLKGGLDKGEEGGGIDRVRYVDSKYIDVFFKLILFTIFNLFFSSFRSKS